MYEHTKDNIHIYHIMQSSLSMVPGPFTFFVLIRNNKELNVESTMAQISFQDLTYDLSKRPNIFIPLNEAK